MQQQHLVDVNDTNYATVVSLSLRSWNWISNYFLHLSFFRVFPGFHDSHIHVSMTGQAADSVDAKDCKSIEDFKARVKQFADKHPAKSWITGASWEQDKLGRWDNLDGSWLPVIL